MKLFIVANPSKPNVRPALDQWLAWMKERATVLGIDTDCQSDLSRVDADVIEIAPQSFNVRRRVEEIVEGTAFEHRSQVEIAVPDDLVAAADPTAFERIVGNLLTNALRYGSPPVIVRPEYVGGQFRVSVEDRGSGVEPAFVPNLFERFSRSEHAPTPARTTATSSTKTHGRTAPASSCCFRLE